MVIPTKPFTSVKTAGLIKIAHNSDQTDQTVSK